MWGKGEQLPPPLMPRNLVSEKSAGWGRLIYHTNLNVLKDCKQTTVKIEMFLNVFEAKIKVVVANIFCSLRS